MLIIIGPISSLLPEYYYYYFDFLRLDFSGRVFYLMTYNQAFMPVFIFLTEKDRMKITIKFNTQ